MDAIYDVHAAVGALWLGLLNGTFVVTDATTTNRSATLALRARSTPLPAPSRTSTPARMLETVLRGKMQKVIAIDYRVSASAVSTRLRQITNGMGLRCDPSHLPLAVVLLAHAVERAELVEQVREGERVDGGPATFVIELKRCDALLASKLSRSEFDVARKLLEGCTYRTIARDRVTSVRTIANQASAIFRKLGVTGRFSLLRTLLDTTRQAPTARC